MIYVQDVSKIIGQKERVSSSHHNEGQSSHKRILGNKFFLCLFEGLIQQ
jgi:hypothetical protein